jgi:RNA-directed DNA polymerase
MEGITQFITQKLQLKLNEAKSAARPQERKFLGFSFTAGPEVQRVIAPKALDRFKRRIREITRRAKGVSMEKTMEELAPVYAGLVQLFWLLRNARVLMGLTRWVRLRLRAAMWRQWKTPRRRRAALLELGVSSRLATKTAGSGLAAPGTSRRPRPCQWGFLTRTSNRSGFPHCSRSVSATDSNRRLRTVCTVVW